MEECKLSNKLMLRDKKKGKKRKSKKDWKKKDKRGNVKLDKVLNLLKAETRMSKDGLIPVLLLVTEDHHKER